MPGSGAACCHMLSYPRNSELFFIFKINEFGVLEPPNCFLCDGPEGKNRLLALYEELRLRYRCRFPVVALLVLQRVVGEHLAHTAVPHAGFDPPTCKDARLGGGCELIVADDAVVA